MARSARISLVVGGGLVAVLIYAWLPRPTVVELATASLSALETETRGGRPDPGPGAVCGVGADPGELQRIELEPGRGGRGRRRDRDDPAIARGSIRSGARVEHAVASATRAGSIVATTRGMAIKRIYCAVDFSPGSTRGLLTAVRLAREREAELVVLHAWGLPVNTFASDFVYPSSVVQHLAEDAQQGLDAARSQAMQLGAARVSAHLVQGTPWQQIVDAAKADPACGLVVIGSEGRTALSRVLLGSVAEMVVRHAPCPVLTVRGAGEPRPFSHVLCPVDFSPWSRAAIDLATELALPARAAITLLHVQEPSVAWGEVRPFDVYADVSSDATKTLQRWGRELAAKVTVPVHQKMRVGRAGAQLLAALDDDPSIDLVVMGSHGRTGITRLALGSVAEKTVRHARCPVAVTHLRG